MASGGNGQAQESAELQKSQSNQSERYGIAGDMFSSKEYLSVLRTKDGENSGVNSGVSRTFGQSVTGADSQADLRTERDMKMKADRERSEQINQLNWQRFQGLKGSKTSGAKNAGAETELSTAGAATKANDLARQSLSEEVDGTMSGVDTAAFEEARATATRNNGQSVALSK